MTAREADLEVDAALGGQVFTQLVGDPLEGLRRLHHGNCVPEALQVLGEGALVGALEEPLTQAHGVVFRQLAVAALLG